MSTALDTVKQSLLTPVGLDVSDIQKTLNQLMTHYVDQADLYFESSRGESWMLEDGIIKEGTHSIDQGVGVRAISGEKTGFAYSDEIVLPALTNAAKTARAIAMSGSDKTIQAWENKNIAPLYDANDPLDSVSSEQKITLLKKIDALARKKDPRVKQVFASLAASYTTILVAGIDGTFNADIRPLVR